MEEWERARPAREREAQRQAVEREKEAAREAARKASEKNRAVAMPYVHLIWGIPLSLLLGGAVGLILGWLTAFFRPGLTTAHGGDVGANIGGALGVLAAIVMAVAESYDARKKYDDK